MVRILLADDHEFIRNSLRQILTEEFPGAFIGEADETASLINAVFSAPWDLVISDFSMPGGGGLKALNYIKRRLPALPILILSIYPADQFAGRVMLAGAAGYLNKDSPPEELIKEVKRILGDLQ